MRRVGLMALILVVAGCAAATPSTPPTAKPPASPEAASPPTAASPTPAAAPRSASCSQSAATNALTGGGVTLYHDPGFVAAQVELISPAGHRVLVDVVDGTALSIPPRADDILLTTHEHEDHYNIDFITDFPGQNVPEGGSTSSGDIKVTGINAAHGTETDHATLPDGTDYVYLIEIGGLRIAHFGDFGQVALTQDQLDTLGRVDIAITQLDNPYSSVNSINHLSFDMIQQLCPRIVIPTHMMEDSDADMALALKMWKGTYSASDHVHITPASLPQTTTLLVLGHRGAGMGPALHLPLSPW